MNPYFASLVEFANLKSYKNQNLMIAIFIKNIKNIYIIIISEIILC